MDEEETVQYLEMINKKDNIRHITDHVNFEEIAEEIYWQVRDHWKLMDEVYRRVIDRVKERG